ncbi:MAG: asparagine synthase (glutamine-hydrolyzing) [Planctomycetota bacterium]|nr:asparagine synthase (glutamine-hydrolyzing) [Planctomycetota bacterium]
MCGILGTIDSRQPIGRDAFQSMLHTLHSRGPDGEGIEQRDGGHVQLGHRRLSIIDLSDAGKQPMPNEDHTVWLVFNGEIYNFQELRQWLASAGHRFRSQTDSEVIVHAYEEWGDDCVHELRGIFAFAIWDERRRRLFLARDQIGVKPLYYWQHDAGFVFASQPRAIVEHPRFTRSLNENALAEYLAYGYVPHDGCIFSGMSKLPAGQSLVYENGRSTVAEYWRLDYKPSLTDRHDAESAVRTAIEEAVELQMVSDVPIGVFLSGGVDSSTVTGLVTARSAMQIPSFTIGFDRPEKDEREYAALAAKALGTKPHVREMGLDDAFEYLQLVVNTYDEPFYDGSALPSLMVAQLAHANRIKVVLAGDGADELFAGYLRYDAFHNPGRTARLKRWLFRESTESALERYFGLIGFLDRDAIELLVGTAGFDHLGPLRGFWNPDVPSVTAAQLLDMKTYLIDDILTKVDRASMASSVEARVPLLDHKLVETAFTIDHSLIYEGSERKSLMKRAVRNWVPPEILTTRKKGFSVPTKHWMERRLYTMARSLLRDGSLVSRGIFRPLGIERLMKSEHPHHTWLVLIAELWSRRWLENEKIGEDELRRCA